MLLLFFDLSLSSTLYSHHHKQILALFVVMILEYVLLNSTCLARHILRAVIEVEQLCVRLVVSRFKPVDWW